MSQTPDQSYLKSSDDQWFLIQTQHLANLAHFFKMEFKFPNGKQRLIFVVFFKKNKNKSRGVTVRRRKQILKSL